jgi:hypothetical protein
LQARKGCALTTDLQQQKRLAVSQEKPAALAMTKAARNVLHRTEFDEVDRQIADKRERPSNTTIRTSRRRGADIEALQ